MVKKEVGVSLAINFGMIAILSMLLFLVPNVSMTLLPSLVAGVFMIIPSFASVVTMKYVTKEEFNKYEKSFVNCVIIGSILLYGVMIISLLMKDESIATVVSLGSYIVSIILIFKVLKNGKHLERFNLRFKKNFGGVAKGVGIFVAMFIVMVGLDIFVIKNGSTINTQVIGLLPIVVIQNLFLGFFMFFGEEFGWRYYLQPRLQTLFGKRIGVIILGVIWGIWHMPLCFTLYSPNTPFNCIISHVVFCTTMGVFLAYVYMKTENIFAPILIHLVNNSLAIILNNGSFTQTVETKDLLIGIVVNALIYLPFMFTKEFKAVKVEMK